MKTMALTGPLSSQYSLNSSIDSRLIFSSTSSQEKNFVNFIYYHVVALRKIICLSYSYSADFRRVVVEIVKFQNLFKQIAVI